MERDYGEFLEIQRTLVNQERWVIDGNCMQSLEMRFQRADMALYFRPYILVCLWRIIKRVFQKEWHIPDLAEGCSKKVRLKLIVYLFQYHTRYGPKIEELRQKYPHVNFILVRSKKGAPNILSVQTQNS